MSFRCNKCRRQTQPGEKAAIVPVQTRACQHPERRDENDVVIDRGGCGTQIVREIQVCAGCSGNTYRP